VKDDLRQLNERISSRAAVVLAPDGMLIASDLNEGLDLDRISALGAAIVTGVGESLRRAGWPSLAQLEVATEQGKVVLVEAGPTYLLVLLGARREIGPGSIEIRSAAERIARAAALSPTPRA
jgi:predicted regulator of Ras-like GTPase activity (Roadblock/LC7/MglB family)